VLALLGGLTLSARALDRAGPPTSAPALLGAGSRAATTAAQQAADGRLEAAIGRKLSIGHSFVPWGAALGDLPAANLAAGRTPMISFGRGASSRAVAAGRHDAYLRSLARSVAGLGQPVLLRYAWGMDGWARRADAGSGPAFVAAWRHVHDLFAAQGVQAFWVWSPTPTGSPAPAAASTATGPATATSTGSAPTASTGTAATASSAGGTSPPSSRPSTPGGRPGPSR
jgi:hypothetical protein